MCRYKHDIEPPEVSPEQEKKIEQYINSLTYNEQLEKNLQYWHSHPSDLTEVLTKKYTRYRVDFPTENADMECFKQIDLHRAKLFNLACIIKLPDQNLLQNYLIRQLNQFDPQAKLEQVCYQLTAMKIIFGALTGVQDSAILRIPEKLDGKTIEENMPRVLHNLRKTNFVALNGCRVQSTLLSKYLKLDQNVVVPSDTCKKLIPSVVGLVNQAMKNLLCCSYCAIAQKKNEGKWYSTWKFSPIQIHGRSVECIAKNSNLCEDLDAAGQPPIPLPNMEGH